ncbi:ABC transporter substrate-binding protein [Hahella sp. CCB-MM4]|uniref:substrate-binding periplasmic protein n=1 Tax=Hahella sp. (strain CCB-MM4) TaxID=1926491 RepID=UPI00143CE682|nr:transporter substrate-binding domain-containing protein [Hahella sp. CCB-MM4]
MIVMLLSLGEEAQARKLVIAGVEEAPLKMYFNRDYYGIDIDVIREALKRMGVDFRFTLIDVGARMLRMAELGQVDMVIAVSRKPSREAYLYYPEASYLELTWHFFIRKEDADKIHFDRLSDLKGHRIGATKGYAYTKDFWSSRLRLMEVNSNEQQIPLLMAGRIDAVPLNTLVSRYELKLAGLQDKVIFLPNPLSSASYYNAFSRHSTYPDIEGLVQRYSDTIQEMKADGTIGEIFNKYLN